MHARIVLILCFAFAFTTLAETVKDRRGAVLDDRAKMENDSSWIYNDWRGGFSEAKRTGKPLLVVLRCVPCLACMGIDASVLSDPELRPALERFVRVRLINANDIDLRLFQFDFDLSFSALIFNGDGTVYGRYGSWTHQKNPADKTVEGFKRALEGALEMHQKYPENKNTLTGKQGREMLVTDPLQLPALAGKYERQLDWDGKVVQSCVHCHQIGDGVRSAYRDQKKSIPSEWIYPMPMPETIGLTLAAEHIARVESVAPDSIASQAGLKPGDDLISFAGQPLLSIADFSWALHHAPRSGTVQARVHRAGSDQALNLELPSGWRLKSDISRRVGTWGMRAMALGGLQLESLSRPDRQERGITPEALALIVKHAGEYGNHAAAKKAGFQKGDVLTRVGEWNQNMSESELIGRILENHQPGEKLKAEVLRGSEKVSLSLPVQ